MIYDGSESICVAGDPVGHVSPIAGPSRSNAGCVNIRPRECRIDRFHLIFIRSSSPISLDCIHEFHTEACGAMEVRSNYHISGSRKQLHVPSIVEAITPCGLRTSMHQEN